MALKTLKTPVTPIDLVKDINDNITELDSTKADASELSNYIPTSQKGAASGLATLDGSSEVNQNAKTATTAKNYDTTTGGIKTKFDSIDGDISGMKSGTVVVGKSAALEPVSAPGNNKYYGTGGAGTLGFYDVPQPENGSNPTSEPFTASDVRWAGPTSGIYALTIPHSGKYPLGVYRQNGAVHESVSVDLQRDNTNVIVRAHEKFEGYVGMI